MMKRSTMPMMIAASLGMALGLFACNGARTLPVASAPAGTLPVVGQVAPAFRLVSNEGTEVALEDMGGRWVVLYFYPKNFTGGCTVEAQNFQRDLERFERLGAVVVGVSVDSVDSHREFCTKEGLTFRLLADTDGAVSASYGSLNERNGNRRSARNTFVIDREGRIAHVFTGVDPSAHSEQVLLALEKLQSR